MKLIVLHDDNILAKEETNSETHTKFVFENLHMNKLTDY